jgi:hypothetical protein
MVISMGGHKTGTSRDSAFVKILETYSLSDIALIKSILDTEPVNYFLQGENMKFLRPVDPVILMAANEDAEKIIELLKPLKLNFSGILFGSRET